MANDRQVSPPSSASDWAREGYETFIRNAAPIGSEPFSMPAGSSPLDILNGWYAELPQGVRIAAEARGVTVAGAWKYIWEVARLCPRENGGVWLHPLLVKSLLVHYVEDVPVFHEYEPKVPKVITAEEAAKVAEKIAPPEPAQPVIAGLKLPPAQPAPRGCGAKPRPLDASPATPADTQSTFNLD